MSRADTAARVRRARSAFPTTQPSRPLRLAALVAGLAMTGSYVLPLYRVADVVEVSHRFAAIVVGAMIAATILARVLRPWLAVGIGLVLLGVGAYWYLSAVPDSYLVVLSVGDVIGDLAVMLSGLSILRLAAVGTWVTAFAPAPVFLSWYLVIRGRYVGATVVAGLALSMLVLTGDAGNRMTLIGTVGAAGTIGFGELADRGASVGHADLLALVLSSMIVGSLAVGAIPIGEFSTLTDDPTSPDGPASLDGAVVGGDEEMPIRGAVTLSPRVRYTIESDEPAYWRSDGYDRYTGGSWVRTGDSRSTAELGSPVGQTRSVTQTVDVESRVRDMPATWRPVAVSESPSDRVAVSSELGLHPDGALAEGERYVVVSERPDVDADDLRRAGTDYPSVVEDRYTQLPDRTPGRVAGYTERLTADAENPYETARTIEAHLRETKVYSLDVDRPEGDIADAFLFEMEAGYCTYFATTMVVMLRTQGIPARLATGYSTGERIDDDRWVVRGLDAHAWVEVYFPGAGWVPFEPTPPQSRDAAHDARLAQARMAGEAGVDTPESGAAANDSDGLVDDPIDPVDPIDDGDRSPDDPGDGGLDPGDDPAGDDSNDDGDSSILGFIRGVIPSPTPGAVGFWLTLIVGVAAGGRRLGAIERIRASIAVHVPRSSDDPSATTNRAYRRLERHLARTVRNRRRGETVRAYVEACIDEGADERVRSVVRAYERTRYGNGVDRATAERIAELVNAITNTKTLSLFSARDRK